MAVRNLGQGDFLPRRADRAFLTILVCYLVIVVRLLYLQGAQGPEIRMEATRMREQRIPMHGHRGMILDRDGRPLAVSLYSGVVGFDPVATRFDASDPKKLAQKETALRVAIARVARILNLPESQLAAKVQAARTSPDGNRVRFVPMKKDVSLEQAQSIRDTRPRLIGFGISDGSKRVYTSGSSSAQVVGFTGGQGVGVAGLERACRKWLDGHEGFAIAEVDDHHREIPDTLEKMVPARDGYDVRTTIDSNAQRIVTEEAQRLYDKYHPIGISVVALDPMTGDIQALVSMPTFDPNPGYRKTLNPQSLADRCTARLYEPGSTLKALTVAAAMDDGTINQNSAFYCGGRLQVGNKVIHCVLHGADERNGHGNVRAVDILVHSCNVGAAEIGMKMGPHALFAAEKKFGLLDRLNIGLPAAQRGRLSFDRNERIYTDAKAARVAFGHSIATTPLHVALAYGAIVNGGMLMKPRLIQSVTDTRGKVHASTQPKAERRALSAETSRSVSEMLREVVTRGTAKVAALPGYQVGGKTGTAKKYKAGAYVGSFIGYVPASPNVKPRTVILVAVDEPHGAYYGADVAAPAFHNIASRLLTYWRVPEDDPDSVQARLAEANLRRQMHLPPAKSKIAPAM